jgi:hypothetical protein
MNIVKLASVFLQATLRSDMANRIMYSTLPHFNPELVREIESAESGVMIGPKDINALQSAVSGAKDIIRLGVISCFDELEFLEDGNPLKHLKNFPQSNKVEPTNIHLWLDLIGRCSDAFGETDKWFENFGGEAWKKIADQLKKITESYSKYLKLKVGSKEWMNAYEYYRSVHPEIQKDEV